MSGLKSATTRPGQIIHHAQTSRTADAAARPAYTASILLARQIAPAATMFPFSPIPLALVLFLLVLFLAMMQVGLFSLAFEKLGLSLEGAMFLLFGSLAGSAINIPLFRVRASVAPEESALPPQLRRLLLPPARPFTGSTLIAVNVGGAVLPVLFSLYLVAIHAVDPGLLLMAVAYVALVSFWFSRPIPGVGIGMPLLVAPVTAALVALMLAPAHSAPLAYCGGTMGVLIGADLLRLRDVGRLGAAVASIGGAGTFDGIFLTGIVAVLLA